MSLGLPHPFLDRFILFLLGVPCHHLPYSPSHVRVLGGGAFGRVFVLGVVVSVGFVTRQEDPLNDLFDRPDLILEGEPI